VPFALVVPARGRWNRVVARPGVFGLDPRRVGTAPLMCQLAHRFSRARPVGNKLDRFTS
jgi:hypothetical protein